MKTSAEITIVNSMGMHARPAALLVALAGRFQSKITVEKDGIQVDGKSIMGVLMLAAAQGTVLRVTAEGADHTEAVAAIQELVEGGFDEP